MRHIFVVGNWKMNATKERVNALVLKLIEGTSGVVSRVVICPPYPYLSQVARLIKDTPIELGAQNVDSNDAGAFTGEVSAFMLKDFGVKYVIVGHSERRSLYGESDTIVGDKIKAVLSEGLKPILCVGESLSQREHGATKTIVGAQIEAIIAKVGINVFADIIIAYEPIWAIGTGVVATSAQAQEVHVFIRNLLAKNDFNIAQKIIILYGGSVGGDNARDLFSCADIDGGLVGGASLKAEDFLQICKAQ